MGFSNSRSVCASISPLLSLVCVAWLAGCAQHSKVTGTWQEGARRDQVFAKAIVVGVSPDLKRRCAFERVLAQRISGEVTKGIASCDVVEKKDPLTREGIEAAVESMQADAVVATSLIDRKWELEDGKGRDARGGGYYKATDAGFASGYYGMYGVPVVYGEFQTAAPVTTLEGEVHVTSKVYETRGPSVVYVMDTIAGGLESTDEGLSTVAQLIADRLIRDGLVR